MRVMVRCYTNDGSTLQIVGSMLRELRFDVTLVMVRCYTNDGSTLQNIGSMLHNSRFNCTLMML